MKHVKHYRKKVEAVLALQLTSDSAEEAARWTGGRTIDEKNPFDENDVKVGLNIPTLQGVKRASEGDYIIQGPEGGFRIMDAGEFENTYERPTRG